MVVFALLTVLPISANVNSPPDFAQSNAAQAAAAKEEVKIGGRYPDFTLRDAYRRQLSLSSLRGKVVLVNIWASWCRPCLRELPSLIKLHNAFGEDPNV